jgi:hypothetical protein
MEARSRQLEAIQSIRVREDIGGMLGSGKPAYQSIPPAKTKGPMRVSRIEPF